MVSLLTKPRHVVKVIPRQMVLDEAGVPSWVRMVPVERRVNVHPVSSYEVEHFGVHSSDSYALTAPPGTWIFDEGTLVVWDHEEFTQRGRVKKNRVGRKTSHDRVVIERGSADAGVQA